MLGLPIALLERSSAHHDALRREFALIAYSETATRQRVPPRLLGLVEDLDQPFKLFTEQHQREVEAARRRGDESVDLVLDVPVTVGVTGARLDRLLDEADQFCNAGSLLTLSTPGDCVEFRRWYLGELVAQTQGRPPTPWSDHPTGRRD